MGAGRRAMGTQLDKRGLMSRGRNNLDVPAAVLDVHREYCRCGCNADSNGSIGSVVPSNETKYGHGFHRSRINRPKRIR